MHLLLEFFHKLHHLNDLIAWGGYLVLFCIVYSETGLFVGFFLPGDALLVTAGIFASDFPDKLNIARMIVLLCVAAIAGDNTGYWFGRNTGPRLFARPDSRFFKRKNLEHAHAFYEKHGPKTVVLARFVPIVRTFGPIVAGIAEMPYRRFLLFSVLGGISWINSMSLLGYYLGRVPLIKHHADILVLAIVALSLVPVAMHALQERKRHIESLPPVGVGVSE